MFVKLFVLCFPRNNNNDNKNSINRYSFSRYYVPNVFIKESNVLIDGKPFYDLPINDKKIAYSYLVNENDYYLGNSLDFKYYSDNYSIQMFDLSKQMNEMNSNNHQQINLIGKIEGNNNNGVDVFFVLEEKINTLIKFELNNVMIR